MSDELEHIDKAVGKLERIMLKLLREQKVMADEQNLTTIAFPRELSEKIAAEVDKLRTRLYGTGDVRTLRLVCDRHDALRVRLIYIDNILRHDVPRQYAESALREFESQSVVTEKEAAGHIKSRTVENLREPVSSSQGLGSLFLDFVGSLFGRRHHPAQARQVKVHTSAKPVHKGDTDNRQVSAKTIDRPEHELRLVYLHKLMERDEAHLIPEGKRPPPIPNEIPLPDYVANFSVRDFAETHFAVRREEKDGRVIARTPEELRKKLQARSRNPDQNAPNAPS